MLSRRILLIPSFALVAVLAFAALGSDDSAAVDVDPAGAPTGDPVSAPTGDPAQGIDPADGVEPPAEVVTGRVVGVDRDGPSVEVVESTIATGSDATDAARLAGEIGPDEEWELDFYVVEGDRRWVDIDPSAVVTVYDCTQACEHVEGTLEQLLTGAPYGGADALWSFAIGDDGRATSADEIYLP